MARALTSRSVSRLGSILRSKSGEGAEKKVGESAHE